MKLQVSKMIVGSGPVPRPGRGAGAVAAAVLAASAACGDGDPAARVPGSVEVRVDTVGGVERLTSSGEADPWRLDTLLTLGGRAGGVGAAAPDEFASVTSVALGPDGLLYVADAGNARIQVFDTTGAWVRTVGRPGQGPAEFDGLMSVAFLADTLLALDFGNARVSLLTPTGVPLATHSAVAMLVREPPRDRLYPVGAAEVVYPTFREAPDGPQRIWRRLGPGGTTDEWIRRGMPTPLERVYQPDRVLCPRERGMSWFEHPYAPGFVAHPAPGSRVWVGHSEAYRLLLLGRERDTLRIVERDVAAPALPDEVWDTTYRRFRGWLSDTAGAGGRIRRDDCTPRDLERPATQAAFDGILVDVDGRLWVERNLPRGKLWEVFDDAGRLVGALPSLHHDRVWGVPFIDGDRVAWHDRDPRGVARVHLGRIVR